MYRLCLLLWRKMGQTRIWYHTLDKSEKYGFWMLTTCPLNLWMLEHTSPVGPPSKLWPVIFWPIITPFSVIYAGSHIFVGPCLSCDKK